MQDQTLTGVKLISFRKLPNRSVYRAHWTDGTNDVKADFKSEEIEGAAFIEFFRSVKRGQSCTLTVSFSLNPLTLSPIRRVEFEKELLSPLSI